MRYLDTLKKVQLECKEYALLDHYLPDGRIAEATNCTSIGKVLELLENTTLDLGENPTPQTLMKAILERRLGEDYLQVTNSLFEDDLREDPHELSRPFNR